MIHLAVPCRSARRVNTPYTAAGFGDRVHTCLLAYLYGKAQMGVPVTLHLTQAMVSGGAADVDKLKSWYQIVELFPKDSVRIRHHDVAPDTNHAWWEYLHEEGYPAERYYYGDTVGMHRYDEAVGFDIAPYLKTAPMLKPSDCSADIKLPTKPYATMQWDAGGKPWSRKRLNPEAQARVIRHYRNEGLTLVTVGAKATNPLLRRHPKYAGFLIANAERHIGVDSGMMHLATLYLRPEQMHIYRTPAIFHHSVRWMASGVVVDYYV